MDYIVLPVGNGSLLIGIWKALKELLAAGVIKHYPRLCVIQAEAVCPIVHAWKGEPGATARTTTDRRRRDSR